MKVHTDNKDDHRIRDSQKRRCLIQYAQLIKQHKTTKTTNCRRTEQQTSHARELH